MKERAKRAKARILEEHSAKYRYSIVDLFLQMKELDICSTVFFYLTKDTVQGVSDMEDIGAILAHLVFAEIVSEDARAKKPRRDMKRHRTLCQIKEIFECVRKTKSYRKLLRDAYPYSFWNSTVRYLLFRGRSIVSSYFRQLDKLEKKEGPEDKAAAIVALLREKLERKDALLVREI